MSTADLQLVSVARDVRTEWRRRWENATPRTQTRIQVGVFLTVVVIAYQYSLRTLAQSLNLDTPLAYIGLVPAIALGLAAIRSRPKTPELAIHDRQLDYIVGLPLLLIAAGMNLTLPRRLSTMFWVWRIDLLSLPFFVAGVAAIIFGVRALWRQRLPVAYLFLAWPLPYSVLLLRELGTFTSFTLSGLRLALHVVHVATATNVGDRSLFRVVHNGRPFTLSVVSACAGVNGMVGFLLVGMAFGAAVTGPRFRKSLWLALGLLLLWCVNLGRLLLIFWTGQEFGEHFAIKVLHPFVGLVTFNLGVLAMLLLLKPFGLRIGLPGTSAMGPVAQDTRVKIRRRPPAVPTVYAAIAVVLVAATVIGVSNAGLRAYDLVAGATGEPKLASYLAYPASPAGWKANFSAEYDWAKPYFGESSTWYRYSYTSTLSGGDLHASLPVIADVIDTKDLFSFSAYGVEACYRFHGYSLRNVVQVSLGGGIAGQALSYAAKNHGDWSIVYWIWPVKSGSSTRYERVILYMLNSSDGTVSTRGIGGVTNVRGSLNPKDATQNRLIAVRSFLVTFAREIVRAQVNVAQGSVLSRPVQRPSKVPFIINGKLNPIFHINSTPSQ